MADALLINPPLTKEESFKRGAKFAASLLPPLGIAYIAAMLEKHGHEVKIIDGIAEGSTVSDVVKRTGGFDIIGLTANSAFALRVKETAKSIKEKDREVMVVVGGSHATTIPSDLLKTGNFDFSIIGEAEQTFLEVAREFDKGSSSKDIMEKKEIKGLAFIDKKNNLIYTEKRPLIQNLDDIPMPARHLLPMHLYKTSEARSNRQPSHSMITSRGCPFSCTYCYQDLYGRTYRAHSPGRVVEEMELLRDKYGAKEIAIWDDNFTLNNQRVIEICRLIREKGFGIPWSCESRADTVNMELLNEMASANCEFIAYGVESGSERMLKVINKGVTKAKIKEAFEMTRKAGIKTRAYFMMGLYDEKAEDIEETIKFSKELDPDVVGFTLYVPFPGTVDYKRAVEDGTYSGIPYWESENVPEFNFLESPIYIPKHITHEKLMKMHKRAYSEFYLRPKYILKQLKQIRSAQDIKRLYLGFRAVTSS